MERIGAIGDIGELAPTLGNEIRPDEARADIYAAALEKQRRLYKKLFEV
jgi:hypothetical protein